MYGCRGVANRASVGAVSTSRPTYMTATRSLTCLTTRQVVGHEEVGQPELVLEVEHQVEDLGLNRHVQCRDWLIRDHQPRVQRQGPGDPHPLALASAEGVGVPAHVLGPQPDQPEQLGHPLDPLLAGAHAVGHQRLGHDVEQRPARVERREGVLEDHLHLAAERPEPALRQGGHVHHAALPVRKRISPAVGTTARRMQRAVVVLPQPLSPTSESVSPSSRWKVTSSTART